MRVSREQAEENRERVIDVASRLFPTYGFDGIGLKDLMKGAGLTHGGFYKQFGSKDDLATLASQRALERATRRWLDAATGSSNSLEAIIEFYLSKDHRAEKAEGCPIVALGSDAARQSAEVRLPFEEGIRAHLEVLDKLLGDINDSGPSEKAMSILSLLIGAVTVSRIIEDDQLSTCVLEAAAREVRRMSACDSCD